MTRQRTLRDPSRAPALSVSLQQSDTPKERPITKFIRSISVSYLRVDISNESETSFAQVFALPLRVVSSPPTLTITARTHLFNLCSKAGADRDLTRSNAFATCSVKMSSIAYDPPRPETLTARRLGSG